jgi:NAD(P)-dependent dehydrogenase (short-subunit alcohol dehydrogenase family)
MAVAATSGSSSCGAVCPSFELDDPQQALAGALRPSSAANLTTTRRAIVVGADSALGWAVMEQLLATSRFAGVGTPVHRPVHLAFDRLHTLAEIDPQALATFAADTALIVFDRPQTRRVTEAFVHPEPKDLTPWARRLHAAGVKHLVVAMPHAPLMLPVALQQGLASLDEAAVATLGFEQLVFMRMASANAYGAAPSGFFRRLAHWVLSQLSFLVPQREAPVRTVVVAKVAAELAAQLAAAKPATRVLPAAVMWHATQQRSVEETLAAWLENKPLPPRATPT